MRIVCEYWMLEIYVFVIEMNEHSISKESVKIGEIDDHSIIIRNHPLDRRFYNKIVAMVVGSRAKQLVIFFIAKFGDAKRM